MDDTLCYCTKAYRQQRLECPLVRFPQSVHGFFRELEPIPGGIAAMQVMKDWGHDVWILTRPSTLNRLCYTEKADWVYRHLGQEWVNKLILCPDKSLLKGDVLIDDTPWPGFEGVQLHFKTNVDGEWTNTLYEVQKLSRV